ncbi:MAG: helicase-related protein, partial [Nanoarchaeota archaeon]|nr:helicase-related protein [Nanoarchaeota archaeon]
MHKVNVSLATDNPALNLALDTIKIGKQALVFANTKRSAEKAAEDISKKVKTKDRELISLSEDVLKSLSKATKQCERLSFCVKKGIAFHHAGLTAKQKELIEDNFRSGVIKVICCTPTLAYGLSIPAFRVIVKDLRRYGPRGLTFIPVLEYLQMAGRAGRPEYNDNYGEAIVIAGTEPDKKKIYEKYVLGEPEDIQSKLAVEPVLRTYVLSLIASNFVNTKKEIYGFFARTFWAFQFADTYELHQKIEKMLGLLDEWEFLRSTKDDFVSADEMENESYKSTLLGKRVAELYIDPLTAHNFIECLRKATGKNVNAFSFLHMISTSIELRPLLRVKTKEYDKIQDELVKYDGFLLENEPSLYEAEYSEFLNSIKTASFFNEWIDEKDEEYLLETYDIRPGEIKVKIDIADWLIYTSEELARILKFQPLLKELVKLRIRLKNGVREELIPLLRRS